MSNDVSYTVKAGAKALIPGDLFPIAKSYVSKTFRCIASSQYSLILHPESLPLPCSRHFTEERPMLRPKYWSM